MVPSATQPVFGFPRFLHKLLEWFQKNDNLGKLPELSVESYTVWYYVHNFWPKIPKTYQYRTISPEMLRVLKKTNRRFFLFKLNLNLILMEINLIFKTLVTYDLIICSLLMAGKSFFSPEYGYQTDDSATK